MAFFKKISEVIFRRNAHVNYPVVSVRWHSWLPADPEPLEEQVVEQHAVVVVGAGPVGLSLTLGLARQGVDVIVLDKESGTADHSRAPAIWAGTQEILAGLGVIDRFVEEGILVPRVELWDVDRQRVLLHLPIDELRNETAYPRLLVLPQSKTERLLADAVRDTTDAEVRFSCEVVGLAQSPSGIEVRYRNQGTEERMYARYVAGCDGAQSTVREEIGGSLEGITYRHQVALADVVMPGQENLRFPRLSTRPTLAIAIRIDAHLWRLILPFSKKHERRSLDERIEEAVRHLFASAEYETKWKSEFRLHRRVSSRWWDGRIVLAGDAAHLNSPVGGQGMNAGIMDAAALTDAMLEALAADDVSPFEEYVRRRRRAIEHGVNRFTDRLTRLLLSGRGRWIRPAIGLASALLRIGPARRRILRRVALLGRH